MAGALVLAFCLMTLKSALVLDEGDGHCLEFGHIHYFKVSELARTGSVNTDRPEENSQTTTSGDCHGTQSVGSLLSLPVIDLVYDLPQFRLVYHHDLSDENPPQSPALEPPRKPPRPRFASI